MLKQGPISSAVCKQSFKADAWICGICLKKQRSGLLNVFGPIGAAGFQDLEFLLEHRGAHGRVDTALERGEMAEQNKSGAGSLRNEPQLVLTRCWPQNHVCFHWTYNPVIFIGQNVHNHSFWSCGSCIFSTVFPNRAPRSLCCHHISLLRRVDQTTPVTALWTQERLLPR